MDDRPQEETEELRQEQAEREIADREPTEPGTRTHERRAERAEYLKRKLDERERSEREADD